MAAGLSSQVRNVFVALLVFAVAVAARAQQQPSNAAATETVVTTFQVKAGMEAEFAQVHAQAWPLYHKLGMVLDKPHVVLRGKDSTGKTFYMEILTWKSGDEPDNAPPEVLALWDKLEALCEPRLGKRGISFPIVDVIAD